MQFLLQSLVVLGLASLGLAQDAEPGCPVVTKTIQSPRCAAKSCDFSNCNFVQTVANPCGCPAAAPTATLVTPCGEDCPYGGCGIQFTMSNMACPTTTSTTRRWRPTTRTTTTSTTKTSLSIGITTIPRPTTTPAPPCPVITRTTQPADCPAIRCPIPSCTLQESLNIPCGCTPKTLLYIKGCATECAGGCATKTQTASALC